MPLGREVASLSPSDIVLDGHPAPPKKVHGRSFQLMSIVAKRLDDEDSTWYGSKPRSAAQATFVLDGDPAPSLSPRNRTFRPMSIVATVAQLSYC